MASGPSMGRVGPDILRNSRQISTEFYFQTGNRGRIDNLYCELLFRAA